MIRDAMPIANPYQFAILIYSNPIEPRNLPTLTKDHDYDFRFASR
jgi:hypothetical protein